MVFLVFYLVCLCPGLLNSLMGLPPTEVGLVVTLVDTKFGLVYSLLLQRLGLPVVGKKSTFLLNSTASGSILAYVRAK